MAELQEGWVRIKNPVNGLTHDCPREAFDDVYKDKGFTLVEEPEEAVDYNSLKVPELKALVEERGIEVDASARKDDLVTALEENDGQTAGIAEEA